MGALGEMGITVTCIQSSRLYVLYIIYRVNGENDLVKHTVRPAGQIFANVSLFNLHEIPFR